jgi:nitrate reductase beta subunit
MKRNKKKLREQKRFQRGIRTMVGKYAKADAIKKQAREFFNNPDVPTMNLYLQSITYKNRLLFNEEMELCRKLQK